MLKGFLCWFIAIFTCFFSFLCFFLGVMLHGKHVDNRGFNFFYYGMFFGCFALSSDLELLSVVRFFGKDGFYARKKEKIEALLELEKAKLVKRKKGSKKTFVVTDKGLKFLQQNHAFTPPRVEAKVDMKRIEELFLQVKHLMFKLEDMLVQVQGSNHSDEGYGGFNNHDFLNANEEKKIFFQSVKEAYKRRITVSNPLVKISEIWEEVHKTFPISREKFENYLLELHDKGRLTLQTAISSLKTRGGIRVPHGVYNYVILEEGT